MRKLGTLLSLTTLLAACVACEAAKSSNPLSPTVSGPIPGVEITAPKTLEPTNIKIAVDNQPVTLLAENAGSSGARRQRGPAADSADLHRQQRRAFRTRGRAQLPVRAVRRRGIRQQDWRLERAGAGEPDEPRGSSGPRLQHRLLLARPGVRL